MGKKLSHGRIIAFFDLDHTIIATNSGKALILRLLSAPEISWFSIVKLVILSLFFKLRMISERSMFFRSNLLVRGFNETRFAAIARDVAKNVLFPLIRPEVRKAIEDHHRRGEKTVIISASLFPLCDPIRRHLGIDDVICTQLATEGGRLTGRPSGNTLCYGKEKARLAEIYCASNGCALESSWYYADSFSDIHLLSRVANPVCVSPDRKLRSAAKSKGWKIW